MAKKTTEKPEKVSDVVSETIESSEAVKINEAAKLNSVVEADGANEASELEQDIPADPEPSGGKSLTEAVEMENPKSEVLSNDFKYEHTEEVPALLGKVGFPVDEDPEIIEDGAAPIPDKIDKVPEDPSVEKIIVESPLPAPSPELKEILTTMQESLVTTQNISTKIDTLYSDAECIIKQLNNVSDNGYLLTAEVQALHSGTSDKGTLSKTFLTISSIVLALLVGFQFYLFNSLTKTERLQNAVSLSTTENISRLDKKMASYDKFLTKPLENTDQQAHVQPPLAGADKVNHTTEVVKEDNSGKTIPVQEKLNRLRNGLPERKLIRKETGDWFIYNKKAEEFVSDVDVIDSLNQAYRRIGRSLVTNIPMPACKALCILKPDGKGGTQIVMTKDFLPM